jgi:hypothetical protein
MLRDHMNKDHQTEDIDLYLFFEKTRFAPISVPGGTMAETQRALLSENAFLDSLLAAIKWIFLYVPGAVAFHMIMLGFALLVLYKDWASSRFIGTAGVLIVVSFMVMLGIGKLSDLKYLRVVGAVAATSILSAIAYPILGSFFPGDSFGLFAKCTLPITILAGYLVKRHTDRIE